MHPIWRPVEYNEKLMESSFFGMPNDEAAYWMYLIFHCSPKNNAMKSVWLHQSWVYQMMKLLIGCN